MPWSGQEGVCQHLDVSKPLRGDRPPPHAAALASTHPSHSSLIFLTLLSAHGLWLPEPDPSVCYEQHLCTPGGRRWNDEHNSTVWTREEACAGFREAGVQEIVFIGDSYASHV